MRVRWKGKTEFTGLIHDKVYEVISIEKRMVSHYR